MRWHHYLRKRVGLKGGSFHSKWTCTYDSKWWGYCFQECTEEELRAGFGSFYEKMLDGCSTSTECYHVLINSLNNFFTHNTWTNNVDVCFLHSSIGFRAVAAEWTLFVKKQNSSHQRKQIKKKRLFCNFEEKLAQNANHKMVRDFRIF